MRTGAIFARGSCRALKWMALLGVVFALGGGEAFAQRYFVRAASVLPEGQALAPVSVTFSVPSEAGRTSATATIVVTVTEFDRGTEGAGTATFDRLTKTFLEWESEQPPVTAAEAGAPLNDDDDIEWRADRTETGVTIDNTAGTATFAFIYGENAYSDTKTAYLRTNRDPDAEDELFQLVGSTTDAGVTPTRTGTNVATVKVDDARTQTYVLNHPFINDNEIDEGDTETLELEADPHRTVPLNFRVNLTSENEDTGDYSLAADATAISQEYTLTAGEEEDVLIVSYENDGDRDDNVVTLTAWTTELTGRQNILDDLKLTVIDQHKFPELTLGDITVPDENDKAQKVASIREGEIGTVTLKADRGDPDDDVPDDEKITVTLTRADDESTADSGDYDLSGSPVTINPSPTTSGTFKIDVDEDEDIGDEVLYLLAHIKGDPAKRYGEERDYEPTMLGPISFSDTTDKQIEARTYAEIEDARDTARAVGAGANGLWEPGETMTLRAEDLFEYAETASVVLSSIVVEDPAILSAATSSDMVTITAIGDGESPISITGTVLTPSSLEVTQTRSNVVTVKFPIMVDAPMITAKDNVQAVADAAVAKAAMESKNGIWESAPNGATAMIALSDLFDVPASIEPRYLAEASTGNVDADVVTSTMMLELEPEAAGMDTITVTAVDTDRPGNAVSVEFDVEVMAQALLRAKSQDDVDMVFEDAGADALVAGGDYIMVDMSMLYEIAAGVEPTYTATSSMPDVLAASASGMMLTLTPMSAGGAMIMVEAVDSASQTIVTVMYDATVAAADITYMLSGPENMHLVEGGMDHANGTPGSAMLTVTASAEVAADTEVMIMRDRGQSTAADDDYMAEALMIMAGETMGTAMVTATDDGMEEPMEELVLYAMVDGMEVDGDVKLYIWDAAVPALPVIAQLLLAFFLAIGGYRRYLRR